MWVTTTTVGAEGQTRTQMRLFMPGEAMLDDPPVTLTKTDSSEAIFAGYPVIYCRRESGGETWSGSAVAGGAYTVGYTAVATSAPGTPTVDAVPRWGRVLVPRPADNRRSFLPYARIVQVTKPSDETWSGSGAVQIYAYDDAGTTKWTKVAATAAGLGGLRWCVGRLLRADPSVTDGWLVGVGHAPLWSVGGVAAPTVPATILDGEGVEPTIAIGGAAALGARVFTDLARSSWSLSAGGSTMLQAGFVVAATGSGSDTRIAFRRVQDQELDPAADLVAALPSWEVPPDGYLVVDDVLTWVWNTAIHSYAAGGPWYDTLEVSIPRYHVGSASQCEDFAYDVELPAPIGSCRIIWCQGAPGIFRRTDPDSAPFDGAVATGEVRFSTATPALLRAGAQGLAAVRWRTGLPYQATAAMCNTTDSVFGLMRFLPREAMPQSACSIAFTVGPTSTDAEAAWFYYDSTSGTPINPLTQADAATALTVSTIGGLHYAVGTLPPPTLPADYPQGSWCVLVRYMTSGIWSSWLLYRPVWDSGSPGQVPLPVYPWDVLRASWLDSDGDLTPAENVGWRAPDRLAVGDVSWSGSLAVSWSAGTLTIDATGIAVSGAATKVRGPWSLTVAESRYIVTSGETWEDAAGMVSAGPTWIDQWIPRDLNTWQPFGFDAPLAITVPSMGAPRTVRVVAMVVATAATDNIIGGSTGGATGWDQQVGKVFVGECVVG